jgi:excisionase family DNA binding protein
MAAIRPRHTVTPTDDEREQLRQFLAHYEQQLPTPHLVGPDGTLLELPRAVYSLLAEALKALARGEAVTVMPLQTDLTTQEAADYLNVSRQFLVRLLDQDAIPYTKVGSHRRIAFGDLDVYKQVRDRDRRAGLARLTQLSDELGMYDDDFIEEARNDFARRGH